MEARALTKVQETQPIIDLVLNGLTSEHSKRAYRQALLDFLAWHTVQGRPPLSKALVQRYKTKLQADGLAPSTINRRLSAVRKLALEAADNGLIDPHLGNGIKAVKEVKSAGVRSGNWLTRAQAQRLLDAPDVTTLKGLRDRALLAALIGSGLRRSEAAALTFDKVTQREGRWVICDLKGKGNRTHTVPIPAWAKAAIDAWAEEAGIDSNPSTRTSGSTLRTGGRVFRSVHNGGYVSGDRMSAQAVTDVVREYAEKCGFDGWRRTTCGGHSPSWRTRAARSWIRSSSRWGTRASKRRSGCVGYLLHPRMSLATSSNGRII